MQYAGFLFWIVQYLIFKWGFRKNIMYNKWGFELK